jgi:hypothetical protein
MSLAEAFARVDAPAMFNRLFKGGASADPQNYLDAEGVIGRIDVAAGVVDAEALTTAAANDSAAGVRPHLADRRARRAARRDARAL